MSTATENKRDVFEFFKNNAEKIADNSAFINSAKELVGLFSKVIRGYKLYPRSNPAFSRFTDQFKAKLDSILNNIPTISLRITTNGFMVAGTLLESYDKDREIVFFLHNDGLREIFFQKGTTREEVAEFFNVIAQCTLFASDDYDLPTLLWDCKFDNIGYITEDELIKQSSSATDAEKNSFSPILVEELSLGQGFDGFGGIDSESGDESGGSAPSDTSLGSNFTEEDFENFSSLILKEGDISLNERKELLDKRLQNFSVGKMEIFKFDEALKKNDDAFVVNRFLKELSTRLLYSQGSEAGLELLETAASLWEKLLLFGSVNGSILFIKTLTSIAEKLKTNQPDYSKKIIEGLSSLKDAEFINEVFSSVEDLPKSEIESIGELFSMIPSSMTEHLVTKISAIELRETRLTVLNSFCRHITISKDLLELTKHSDWKVVRNALALMKEKKDPKVLPAIRSALSHPQKQAQIEALGILMEFSIEEALPALEMAVFSSSREIRTAAFNKILELKDPKIRAIINRSMQVHNLNKLENDEIDLHFKTVIDLGRNDLYDLLANNLFCDDPAIKAKVINALFSAPTLASFSKFIAKASEYSNLMKMKKNEELKLFCKLYKPEIYTDLLKALEPLFFISGNLFNKNITNMKETVFKALVVYIDDKTVVTFFKKGLEVGNKETISLIRRLAAKYL